MKKVDVLAHRIAVASAISIIKSSCIRVIKSGNIFYSLSDVKVEEKPFVDEAARFLELKEMAIRPIMHPSLIGLGEVVVGEVRA